MPDTTPATPAPASPPLAPPAPPPAAAPFPKLVVFAVLGQAFLLVAAIAVGGYYLYHAQHPAPVVKPFDPAFVPVGRQYADAIAIGYAGVWDQAADDLDSGKPFADTMSSMSKAWQLNRTQLFDQALMPELSKILPESTPEANITAAQRQSMARAWRGLAQGLRK